MAENTADLGQKLVTLSSQYIQIANNMSLTAYINFKSGNITRDDYTKVHDNVQNMLQQAAQVNRQAADVIYDNIAADVGQIDSATKNLQDAAVKIKNIENIVNLSTEALQTLASVALAVTAPTPASIVAAVQQAIKLANDITSA